LQVNHQHDAQPKKQKREAFSGPPALLSVAFSVWPELGLRGWGMFSCLTGCVTGGGADVDNAWGAEKTQSQKNA